MPVNDERPAACATGFFSQVWPDKALRPYGRTGTVETELYGEPSMILRLTAR